MMSPAPDNNSSVCFDPAVASRSATRFSALARAACARSKRTACVSRILAMASSTSASPAAIARAAKSSRDSPGRE